MRLTTRRLYVAFAVLSTYRRAATPFTDKEVNQVIYVGNLGLQHSSVRSTRSDSGCVVGKKLRIDTFRIARDSGAIEHLLGTPTVWRDRYLDHFCMPDKT